MIFLQTFVLREKTLMNYTQTGWKFQKLDVASPAVQRYKSCVFFVNFVHCQNLFLT